MWDIELFREQVNRALVGAIWALAPIAAGVAYGLGGPWGMVGTAGFGVALLATGVWRLGVSPAAARVTIAVALIGQISLLLGAAAGGAWQVDIHMAYFAAVALIGVYCDPFALAAATAAVALHHLSLNFLLPEAIYPGGPDFLRVLLHAAILAIESAGLIWMSAIFGSAFAHIAVERRRADEALAAATAAIAQAETAREAERREAGQKQTLQSQMAAEQGATAAILANRLAGIATGDLTTRITETLEGQYGAMKSDFNAAIGKLQTALQAVNARATSVRDEAGRFAETAETLSARSEQQAASLLETVTALDRIKGLIKHSTDRALGVREVVSSADADAKQSGEIVGKAVEAMAAITTSSSRIGQIISVIDEISFQTNLLALNAGVEAARAGDSGKGFAVVASEVRALAQRSAQAAKEIKELISASMTQVEAGAELVTGAGGALESIARKVSEINGMVGEFADSARDQLAGVSEIHRTLTQVDSTTQQNAAMAREATVASRQLAGESEELGNLMRQFRIGDAPAAGRSRLADAPPAVARPRAAAPPARVKSADPKPAPRLKAANDDWSEF